MSSLSAFNVSTSSGPLASFLNQTASSGLLGALGGSTAANATTTALKTGGLTTSQHNALVSIASAGTAGDSIQWNANGTEPTTLQNLRTNGWAKLTRKVTTDGKVTGGVYTLTAVGKAIYNRTGGGTVGSTPSSSSTTSSGGVSAATKAALTAALSTVQSFLGSSSSASSSTGVSTATTGQNASNILSGSSAASSSSVDLLA